MATSYPSVVGPGGSPGEIYRGWLANLGITTTSLSLDPGTYLAQLATAASAVSAVGELGPTGAVAQSMPRYAANVATVAIGSSQVLNLYGIWLLQGQVVANITFVSGTTGATSPTNWWYALYSSSRVMLAQTADQTTTAFSTSTAYTLAIAKTAAGTATSYTVPSTGYYYVGILMASGGQPTLTGIATTAAINGIAPKAAGTSDTGVTTPPAFPHTAGTITATAGFPFFYLT